MNRFYCFSHNVRGNLISIRDADQMHHIKNVLRFSEGAEAVIFDEKASVYTVRLEKILPAELVFAIMDKKAAERLSETYIAVACAIPKKSKIDDIIDKLTQLDVDRIIPLMTERVIVKLDSESKSNRQKRWDRIALSAVKQSQRNTVPVIDPVTDIQQVIGRAKDFDLKLIPSLAGKRRTLKEILKAVKKPKNVLVLIGPEGDFSPHEVEQAIKAGFIPVTFGDLVLRVETAAVYIASILKYELR